MALAHPNAQAQTAARAFALHGAANLTSRQADLAAAAALHQECLVIQRALGNEIGTASSLMGLGIAAFAAGDLDGAQRCYEETLALYRRLNAQSGLGDVLNDLGNLAVRRGTPERARPFYEEALAVRRRRGTGRASPTRSAILARCWLRWATPSARLKLCANAWHSAWNSATSETAFMPSSAWRIWQRPRRSSLVPPAFSALRPPCGKFSICRVFPSENASIRRRSPRFGSKWPPTTFASPGHGAEPFRGRKLPPMRLPTPALKRRPDHFGCAEARRPEDSAAGVGASRRQKQAGDRRLVFRQLRQGAEREHLVQRHL